jgi:hypothetical protein
MNSKKLILQKLFCFSLILCLSFFAYASAKAHSKKTNLTDEDRKLLKSNEDNSSINMDRSP